MEMYVRLSNILDAKNPGWPNAFKCMASPVQSIKNGAVNNVYIITLMNHFGTHFDAPNHYVDSGPKISELPIETFFYEKPLLADIPKSFEEFVTAEDLKPYAARLKEADFLMIRSGFCKLRETDPSNYAARGPAVGSDAAKYLMDNFRLKAIAVDWISLASVPHTGDGDIAHHYLLGKYHDHYTCIIEDACFEGIAGKKLKRVTALPLLTGMGVDSGPVTIVAEVED
ncbi:MAG: cyclase family protein [Synergistaceae bacterium]|jgi:kynurenine formamidase|nr:cyclase family protein [Synergistaceae bacterium]